MAIFRNNDLRDAVCVAKALSDEGRLRALCALRAGELCVCHLVELLGLAQSTVSKHMSILHQARLVECRRDGRWLHYRLAGADASPAVRAALAWALDALGDDDTVAADADRARCLAAANGRPAAGRCGPGHAPRRHTPARPRTAARPQRRRAP